MRSGVRHTYSTSNTHTLAYFGGQPSRDCSNISLARSSFVPPCNTQSGRCVICTHMQPGGRGELTYVASDKLVDVHNVDIKDEWPLEEPNAALVHLQNKAGHEDIRNMTLALGDCNTQHTP